MTYNSWRLSDKLIRCWIASPWSNSPKRHETWRRYSHMYSQDISQPPKSKLSVTHVVQRDGLLIVLTVCFHGLNCPFPSYITVPSRRPRTIKSCCFTHCSKTPLLLVCG